MSTLITYEITIENIDTHVIADKLKKLNLNVLPWEIKDIGKKAFDPNHILCSEVFLENEPIIASMLIRIQTLKNMAGIQDAKFANETKLKEKTSWLPIILPIITSTAGTAVAVLSVLLGLAREFNLKLDLMAYVLYLGIPSATSFLSGLGGLKLERTLRRTR